MRIVTIAIFSLFLLSPLISLAADWEPCYLGLLRCDENGIIWQEELVTNQAAQLSSSDGLGAFMVKIGQFMNGPLIGFLLAIAFLLFLVNIARYFIIEPTNTDKKEEAKRVALYGIAAFVFLISLWGIVNLFVIGLGFDRAASICPDYLEGWCGDLDNFDGGSNLDYGSSTSGLGGNAGGTGGNNNGGNGSGGNGTGNGGGGTNQPGVSRLGMLVYGQYQESVNFNFRAGDPRAQTSVVSVASNATCSAGLATLRFAAKVEALPAAYLMYKENGVTRFRNLSDITTATSLDIDADTMLPIMNSASTTKPVIIHTHPQPTIEAVPLAMDGHGPTVSDMELLCDNVADTATYLVVDQARVWQFTKTPNTCPRTTSQTGQLMTIDTLLQLSTFSNVARQSQYDDLIAATNVPSGLKSSMQTYQNTNFGALSSNEVFLLADDLARTGNMQIRQFSVDEFCNAY